MPEPPPDKARPHPFRLDPPSAPQGAGGARSTRGASGYVELGVTSNFTFLTGASHPEEMVERAASLGHAGASIADVNTLAGVVRAHVAARKAGIPLSVGSRLRFEDPGAPDLIVYPTSREAYASLCRLLTLGKRRAPKGECSLRVDDLSAHSDGLVAIAMAPDEAIESGEESERTDRILRRLRSLFDDDRLSLGVTARYAQDDGARRRALVEAGGRLGVPLVAMNDALYHVPERRMLQDVVTCIRHACSIDEAGLRLRANAERHLKPAEEMARLFRDLPGAVERTIEIHARASAFSMDELKYEYPVEPCPPGVTPMKRLYDQTWAGAQRRYPGGIPAKVRRSLEHELALIDELRYEAYFLTCCDIVEFARGRGILCQGRGGAANSAVCYCLGITEVDPSRFSLLFERFVSRERGEPPDIDIDFEHERREEVIQYLYEKYGRDRAALTAEVVSYRGRSGVREVGKALGLSPDRIDAIAKNLDLWSGPAAPERLREVGLNPDDPGVRRLIDLTAELVGFPRHLSQHVGGFVITRTALSDLVPIENAAMEERTVIEWDKDDIDAMGMLKVDCLGLGMLTCVRKAFELVRGERGEDLTIPRVLEEFGEDPHVYAMIQRADTLGVFQIESRAQMTMLPRLRPETFYDLVIEVAIVRPGPIQGGMVHPYLRRRTGEEPIEYPRPEVQEVLGRTLGVPIFQEQVMQLAIVAAGFTPDQSDALRQAMKAWRKRGNELERFRPLLLDGMRERGYPAEFAERCFEQIRGFGEYGFPESHAASFALLVYVSCWLKRYEPGAFAAALINSQPMGFYQPAQIVRDAKEHGVEVRPVDVHFSGWDCSLERDGAETGGAEAGTPTPLASSMSTSRGRPAEQWGEEGPAIRLGMRLVKGMPEEDAHRIKRAVRAHGRFDSIESLWRASGASVRALKALARGDAFASMGLDRQAALWKIRPLRDERLPLFEGLEAREEEAALPRVSPDRLVLHDYASVGLSLKAHPMSFMRDSLGARGVIEASNLRDPKACPQGRRVEVAGVVLVRQRPGTASGVVFITLEDETGVANLVIWADTFEKYRRVARLSGVMLAQGRVERQNEVVHVHVSHLEALDKRLPSALVMSRDFH